MNNKKSDNYELISCKTYFIQTFCYYKNSTVILKLFKFSKYMQIEKCFFFDTVFEKIIPIFQSSLAKFM